MLFPGGLKLCRSWREGYMKFSGNAFFFFLQYSANFLNKRQVWSEMFCRKHVWKWADGELSNFWKKFLLEFWKKPQKTQILCQNLEKTCQRGCATPERTAAPLYKARSPFVLCVLPPSPTFTPINSVIVSSSHFLPRYAFNVSNLPSSQEKATRSYKFFSNSK